MEEIPPECYYMLLALPTCYMVASAYDEDEGGIDEEGFMTVVVRRSWN